MGDVMTNERAREILLCNTEDAMLAPGSLRDRGLDARDPDEYRAAMRAGADALSEVERLRRELAELRKPVDVLPRWLDDAVVSAAEAAFEFGKAEQRDPKTSEAFNDDAAFEALRTAILKALNERGGGK